MKDTHHEKIMISTENKIDFAEAKRILDKLETLNGHYNPAMFREAIKELLPEYQFVSGNQQMINYKTGNNNNFNRYTFQN